MSRVNLDDNRCVGLTVNAGFGLGQADIAIAAAYTITPDHAPVLRITPTGAQNLIMPLSNDSTKDMVFWIHNIGAGGILTLLTSLSGAFSPAITIPVSGGWVMVQCTGSSVAASGWKLVSANLP